MDDIDEGNKFDEFPTRVKFVSLVQTPRIFDAEFDIIFDIISYYYYVVLFSKR